MLGIDIRKISERAAKMATKKVGRMVHLLRQDSGVASPREAPPKEAPVNPRRIDLDPSLFVPTHAQFW